MRPDAVSTILVVDDNPATLYSTSRVLVAGGFVVHGAPNGEQAVRLAATLPVDLIVLDVNLPDFDGYEVCRRVRAALPGRRIPVIYLSASFIDDVHKVRGYEAGADGYLTHPVESTVLIATVRAFLRTRGIELEREELLARERAARAEAERANRVKDEFLATLSHELRTPLNAITGWVEVARLRCEGNEHVLHALDVIERNAMFQAQLVSDLLDVSAITSGKLRVDLQPMYPARIVEMALEGVLDTATAKQITIHRTIDRDAGPINGDAARLQQIVANLVTNAVKFSPEESSVHVRLTRDGDIIELTVEDEGRGIRPELLPRIFDRFWQEDTSSRRSNTGLGLGLAIVNYLTEMHGGTATAESRGEGLGATFRVRIPALAEGGAGLHHTPTDEHALAALSGVRVLIVDDDADARQWVRQILVGAQADARAVNGAAQALDEVVRFAPHVIISDLAMPSRDGFDLLLELRSRGFPAATLPAIALSAFSGAADRQKALDTGFQAFLPKPVDPRDILLALRRVLAPVSAPAVNSESPG